MDDRLKDFDDKMDKTVDFLAEDLSAVRAGRANPHVLDKIKVDYYGTPTPLQSVGNVTVPEARMIQIAPWEKSMIKEIEKAIVASDLGLAPQNDGRIIRLNIPPLSTDVRKKLVTRIKELTEESKVAIRSIRRDANKAIETAEKDKVVGEDASNKAKDEVQELTKKFEASASDLAKGKEAEVMEA